MSSLVSVGNTGDPMQLSLLSAQHDGQKSTELEHVSALAGPSRREMLAAALERSGDSLLVAEAAASVSAALHNRTLVKRLAVLEQQSERDQVRYQKKVDAERLLHNNIWRFAYLLVVCVHLCLAFVEAPSHRDPTSREWQAIFFLVLEFLFLTFYSFDAVLRWYSGVNVLKDSWLRLRLIIIALIFFNIILRFLPMDMPLFARVLRPGFLIERMRNVRKITSSVCTTMPKVMNVLVLLMFWVGFFGVFGFTLFAGVTGPQQPNGCTFLQGDTAFVHDHNLSLHYICSTYAPVTPSGQPCTDFFMNVWTSMMQLFILLTTANYPDIMMPAYNCSHWASWFFLIYITGGLYFLLSLILAVVYNHFAERSRAKTRVVRDKRNQALEVAFDICAALTSRERGGADENRGEKTAPLAAHAHSERPAVSMTVWKRVVKQYNRRLPDTIVESLFEMHDDDGHGLLYQKQFERAALYLRLRVRKLRGDDSHDSSSQQVTRTRVHDFKYRVRRKTRRIVVSHRWTLASDTLVSINALIMILRLSPGVGDDDKTDEFFLVSLDVLLAIFCVEVIAKIYALGFHNFCFDSHFNKIDLVAVGGGVVSRIMRDFSASSAAGQLKDVFLLIRLIRLLRVLRLNRAFRIISATVIEISPALARYAAVVAMLFYAYAILGMECFSYTLGRNRITGTIEESVSDWHERVARLETCSFGRLGYWNNNFDTFSSTLVTLFEQMVVNNWPIVMEGCVAGVNSQWPRLYFISFWIICVVVVMNVLIAFLLDAYQAHVELIQRRLEVWARQSRRRLASQGSLLSTSSSGDLERSTSQSSNSSERIPPWRQHLNAAGRRLGHDDIVSYKIVRLRGVGEIYEEIYEDLGAPAESPGDC